MNATLPIGIFDSGVGGLTVYQALRERLPLQHFVYLGDTARVPYGTKSLATVERYAVENARFLYRHGIKLLIVACNTASALALPAIERAIRDVPVIGVIEPGARAAVAATKNNRIGVIATEATINSKAYLQAINAAAASNASQRNTSKVFVMQAACPLFVPLAEEGEAESQVAQMMAQKYLQPLKTADIDALVLGCTHYPILRRVIGETMGAQVRLIDSGAATADEIAKVIKNAIDAADVSDDTQEQTTKSFTKDNLDHFYVTDAAQRFARVAERFLGSAPRKLEAVEVWGADKLEVK